MSTTRDNRFNGEVRLSFAYYEGDKYTVRHFDHQTYASCHLSIKRLTQGYRTRDEKGRRCILWWNVAPARGVVLNPQP